MSNVDELNWAVTNAVMEAEALERRGQDATEAYRWLSAVEARLAVELAPDSLEGRLARLGAVRAALKAGDAKLALGIVDAQYSEARGRGWEIPESALVPGGAR